MSRAMLLSYPNFVRDAADFDGTNDYFTHGGTNLTGAVASGLLTGVIWIKPDSLVGQRWLMDYRTCFQFILNGGAQWVLTGTNPTPVQILNAFGTNLTSGVWQCVMFSFDMSNSSKRHMYVNDTDSNTSYTTYTNSTFNFANVSNIDVCVSTLYAPPPFGLVDGGIAQFWFAPGVYIDLSVTANRRLFISASGKPVNLGSTGQNPTGTAPAMYLSLAKGEAAANFATNRGTGGNFTVGGTLTTYASSPSD